METKKKRAVCHHEIKRHTYRHGRATIHHETDGTIHRYWCGGHMGDASNWCVESKKRLSVRHLFKKYANKKRTDSGLIVRRQTAWESLGPVWETLKALATVAVPLLCLWRILIWYFSG